MNFQVSNFLIVAAVILFALFQTVMRRRSGVVLTIEAVAMYAVIALCWDASPDTLLSGIAVLQVRYLFEMAQQLRFAVQPGILHFVFEGVVLICTGAQVVLLFQIAGGWVEVLCWVLLVSTILIALIDSIRKARALRKDAHWLKKRG